MVVYMSSWCSACVNFTDGTEPQVSTILQNAGYVYGKVYHENLSASTQQNRNLIPHFPSMWIYINGKPAELYLGPRTPLAILRFYESTLRAQQQLLSKPVSRDSQVFEHMESEADAIAFCKEHEKAILVIYDDSEAEFSDLMLTKNTLQNLEIPFCFVPKNKLTPYSRDQTRLARTLPSMWLCKYGHPTYFLGGQSVGKYPSFATTQIVKLIQGTRNIATNIYAPL